MVPRDYKKTKEVFERVRDRGRVNKYTFRLIKRVYDLERAYYLTGGYVEKWRNQLGRLRDHLAKSQTKSTQDVTYLAYL